MIRASACLKDHLAIRTYAHAAKAERPDSPSPKDVGPLLETTQEVERCASAYTYPRTDTPSTGPARRRIPFGGALMGARLIGEVLAWFSDLPGPEFKVLVRMAHTALDEDRPTTPARRYFGGRDVLVATLYREMPDVEEEPTRWKSARKEVSKVLGRLVQAGAIARVGEAAHTGSNQVYDLTLKRAHDYQPGKRGGRRMPRETGQSAPPETGQSAPPVDKETGQSAPPECERDRAVSPPLGTTDLRNHQSQNREERSEEADGGGRISRIGRRAWTGSDDPPADPWSRDDTNPWLRSVK